MQEIDAKKQALKRWAFLILSSIIMVFYSEKMYWYVQGYAYVELSFYYIFGVYMFFWIIQKFRVQSFWPMFVAAVSYPLYVEGLFTGIITLDTSIFVMLSYFIGWHTTLSVILGWYFHHKWLIQRETGKIIASSILIGIFWGAWSVVYWTETQTNDPEMQEMFKLGQWRIYEFALLAFYLAALYALAHFLIGKVWIRSFQPGKLENITIGLVLLFFLIIQILTAGIFVFILLLHFVLLFLILRYYRDRVAEEDPVIFEQLHGEVRIRDAMLFLLMPFLATVIYGIFSCNRPADAFIDDIIFNGIVFLQLTYGFLLYLFAIYKTLQTPEFDYSQIENNL